MIDSTHIKADRLAAAGTEGADYLCSPGGCNSKIHGPKTGARLITLLLTGGEAHDYPIAKRLIRRAPKHMLRGTAYHDDELREKLASTNESGDDKPQQQNSTVPLRQAPVQASLVRERLQQDKRLQAHRNSL